MLGVGDRLRNYEILAQLMPGGMGTLFLGRRVGAAGFTQHVAIKLIHPHLSNDPSFVTSFVNEALLGARVEHPNVVRVEELGEDKGSYFLVMEYVHGFSVAELLKKLRETKRALSPEVAVAIAARVAEGLQAVHETKGENGEPLALIHRDVSPSNILISTSGNVKLIDFGIAKAMAVSGGVTTSGSLKGKIRYMSPEQAHGKPLDHKSDIYSLGIVLWEMLTRRRMFKQGEDLAVLDRVRSPVIDPPSKFYPSLPRGLDVVVMQALRKDPSERPPNARELRMRLYAAVPRGHDVDSSHLAELIADVMSEEIAAKEALIPTEARPAVPPPSIEPTAMTVTGEVSDEAALADTPSFSLPKTRTWPLVGVSALLLLFGIGAAWMLSAQEEKPAPAVILTPVRDIAQPEVPIVNAPPPEEKAEIEKPHPQPVKKTKVQRKRRLKQEEEPGGPTRVDGVPILEDPGF